MTTETYIKYDKNYLPGYTGHVPQRNDIFGMTSGDTNKLVVGEGDKPSAYHVDIAMSKPMY